MASDLEAPGTAETASPSLWRSWLAPKSLTKLLGIGLFVYLVRKVEWESIGELLGTANLWWVAGAAFCATLSVSLKAVRWQWILRGQGVKVGLGECVAVYYGAFYIGLLTPGRLGEVVKSFHLQHRHGVRLRDGVLSVVTDRLQDILALVVACAVTYGLYVADFGWWPVIGLSTLALGLGLPLVAPRVVTLLYRPFGELASRMTGRERFRALDYDGIESALRKGSHLGTWLMTAASYFGFFGVAWVLAMSIGLELPFSYTVLLLSATSLLALLPVSVSGIGTREVSLIYYFAHVGYSKEQAMAFSLLLFATCYVLFALIGFAVWLAWPLPLTPVSTRKAG